VSTAHGLIEDRERNLVVTVIVEDDEVASHDLVALAEPPLPVGQVQGASAVEEEICGPYAGGAAVHPQHILFCPHVDDIAKLAG
jgi:hypothetical protein